MKIYVDGEMPKSCNECVCRKPLKQPPMDWCYVEEKSDVKD